MARGGFGLAQGPRGVDMVFAFSGGRRGRECPLSTSTAALPVPRVSDSDVVLSRIGLGCHLGRMLLGWLRLFYWAGMCSLLRVIHD